MARQEGKRVGIAVNHGEESMRAVNYYLDNFASDNDSIVFIHSPEAFNFTDASRVVVNELVSKMNADVKKLEEDLKELLASRKVANVKFRTVKAGKPGKHIVAAAKEENCDVIVTGCRGRSAVKGFFLGSVSQDIAQRAECPVIICKSQ